MNVRNVMLLSQQCSLEQSVLYKRARYRFSGTVAAFPGSALVGFLSTYIVLYYGPTTKWWGSVVTYFFYHAHPLRQG